jgi:hypothetical protein
MKITEVISSMYPTPENLHNEDSQQDDTSLVFQYCAYYGFSVLAVMISLLSATSSAANYLISTSKSTYEIGDEITQRLIPEKNSTASYIEYAVGGFLGVLILACVSSILYQRFSKNYPKVHANTTKCISLPTTEEATPLNQSSQRHIDTNILIPLREQLNYIPVPKKKANLLIRLSEYPAFFSELILGAGSAATLVDSFLKIFTGDNVLVRQVFDGIGALLVGGSNGYVFKTVMSYQREQYDCHNLMKQHIREKYKHRSALFQETLIQTSRVIRHLIIDSALFFGELGDYTSFEVIATMLFGELNTMIRAIGILMCLSIAMTKWVPNHDKFDGVLFSVLKGAVYKNQHAESQISCINSVTYPLSIIGTGYKNLMNTTYQVFKTTGNVYMGLISGVASCLLGAANTALMLHDLDKVDMEQLEREKHQQRAIIVPIEEQAPIEERFSNIEQKVTSCERLLYHEIDSVSKTINEIKQQVESVQEDVEDVKKNMDTYSGTDDDAEGIFDCEINSSSLNAERGVVVQHSDALNERRRRSYSSGNKRTQGAALLSLGHFSHSIIHVSINTGEPPSSESDLLKVMHFGRLSSDSNIKSPR